MTSFNVIHTAPVIEIIGVTQPQLDGIERALVHRNLDWNTDGIEKDPLALAEFGGRVCYESFDNKKGRSRIDYIKDTALNKEHGSIIEHVWFNFAVLDLPRTTLMELTRHRVGTAYSWRSTRYVDNWLTYVCPPLLRRTDSLRDAFQDEAKSNFDGYIEFKARLKEQYPDLPRKEIVEAARSILSGAVVSDGEFSVNLRELLHILKLRSAQGADASMQEFAAALQDAAYEYIKDFIGDKTRTLPQPLEG